MKTDERRSRYGALSLVLFLSICTNACSSCGDEKKPPPPAADAALAAPAPSPSPSSRPSTTSPGIAWNNFNADIAQRQTYFDKASPKDKLTLVEMFLDRSHYLGTIADLTQAETLAKKMNDADGGMGSGEAHFARALVANALHHFDEASKELEAANQSGMPPLHIQGTRASIFMGRGDYDEAFKLQQHDLEHRDALTIASAAVLATKLQKPAAESDKLFDLARERFRDVSPFALAWMDFQRGTVLELAGEDAKARVWFAEAVDVLPEYTHAAVHLAPTEAPADAIKRLELVKKTSDDPEVLAALAKAHERAGHVAEPPKLIDEAKKRYTEVVAKYPEAFADHAARFWLNAGNDPQKALELARLNAKNRGTEEAFDLWMAAAAGAKNQEDLCLAVHAMAAFKYLSPRGKSLVTASLAKCPD